MRILGALGIALLASSFSVVVACGDNKEEQKPVSTAEAVSAASVSIELYDESGVRVGEGSGVLIAPTVVLTSGHLVAGKAKWIVKSTTGARVNGTRGLTYDWQRYDSDKAHPRRHDVGVIHLDSPIKLAAYPQIVGADDAIKGTRIRNGGSGFEKIDVALERMHSAPSSYLANFGGNEALDTGGVVYDERGIIGVVSGVGVTTGKLYIAKTGKLTSWLSPKIACSGSAHARNLSIAPEKPVDCDASAPSSDTNNPPGSNNPPSPNNPPNDCSDDHDGHCHGACGGNPGHSPTGGPSSNDNPPGSNNPPGGGPNGNPTGNPPGGGNPPSGGPSPNNNPPNGGPNNHPPSGPSGVGGNDHGGPGGHNGPGESEVCQGPDDSPDVCPVEPDGCAGPECGGGSPDNAIFYGSCGCGGKHGDPAYDLH